MPPALDDPTSDTPSPKRKREDQQSQSKKSSPVRPKPTRSGSPLETDDDSATGSPRTKVAYHFKGLQIEGSVVPKFELGGSPPIESTVDDPMDEDIVASKRMRVLSNEELEIPETPQVTTGRLSANASVATASDNSPLSGEVDPVVFKGIPARSSASKLARAYPSINRLADSKSRNRKRMGTPPFAAGLEMYAEVTIVDPYRAALTWHDDEITGHDPDDPDDDGEGINGIGFKPTPAIAYARAEMRRKQLAEYRTRESKEERAKRSERRKGNTGSSTSGEEAARRVRFMGAESNNMITTS